MSVYKSIKGKTISPASGKILDVDFRIPDAQNKVLNGFMLTLIFKWNAGVIYTTHPAVFIWHQSSRASLAERVSLLSSVSILITWIWRNIDFCRTELKSPDTFPSYKLEVFLIVKVLLPITFLLTAIMSRFHFEFGTISSPNKNCITVITIET